MSLDIEVPHVRSPSLGVLILTLNLALFLPQTINRTPPYVLAGSLVHEPYWGVAYSNAPAGV
ncbi:GABA receptor subunit [Culex quinquefasciatus]|uniref:GABA receptor subunit n=1 Tax=Culex quinquefasciatus TaxID=7176 RepID=B0WN12_CULQU|nr:GABA receptor subunit [Culex quinquefasciatus]|eukprot:XP_001850096.1 GABA receptor subunit [Culex quinquefasciatus]